MSAAKCRFFRMVFVARFSRGIRAKIRAGIRAEIRAEIRAGIRAEFARELARELAREIVALAASTASGVSAPAAASVKMHESKMCECTRVSTYQKKYLTHV